MVALRAATVVARGQGVAYRVKDINTTSVVDGPSNPFVTVVNGAIVFLTATDASHGAEAWRSDGTAPGTFMLRDFTPGSGTGSPLAFGTMGP